MTDYSNWKILKSVINYVGDDEEKQQEVQVAQEEYTAVAEWCNESRQYHIEEQGDYYAVVKNAEPTEEEIKQARIAELKALLASTDYTVIKIAEGAATPEEYADVIAQRQAWRAEINELEG